MANKIRTGDFTIKCTDGMTDIRLDKVAYIKYAIENRIYNVSSEDVASVMLLEFFLNELSTQYKHGSFECTAN